MSDQIVSKAMIRERARKAFAAGKTRDDHNMNPCAAALPTWQKEFDRLAAEARHDAQHAGQRDFVKPRALTERPPALHSPAAGVSHIDARHAGGAS